MPAHEKPLLRRTKKKAKISPTQEAMEASKAL